MLDTDLGDLRCPASRARSTPPHQSVRDRRWPAARRTCSPKTRLMSAPHLGPLPDLGRPSAIGSIKQPSPKRLAITRLPKPAVHMTTLEPQESVESGCGAVAVGPNLSVAAPFVWRCLTGSTVAPFPHPAHRPRRADFPHPALGQDVTPCPRARCADVQSGVRDRNARRGARVDKSHPCVA